MMVAEDWISGIALKLGKTAEEVRISPSPNKSKWVSPVCEICREEGGLDTPPFPPTTDGYFAHWVSPSPIESPFHCFLVFSPVLMGLVLVLSRSGS